MKFENDYHLVEIEPHHGSIVRIFDKKGGIEIIKNARLAESFRLLLPLPETQAHYVLGSKQKVDSIDQTSAGLVVHWKSPLESELGRSLALDARLHIECNGPALSFRLEVKNNTDLKIAEAWYPVLGGLQGIKERKATEDFIPAGAWTSGTRLFSGFLSIFNLGIPEPEHSFSYPGPMTLYPGPMPMSWCDFCDEASGRGMYFGIHDPIARHKVARFALLPGIGGPRYGDNWPNADEVDKDTPLGIVANWTLFPYTAPGETFNGPPVIVQFHSGGWKDGAAIYKEWFKQVQPAKEAPTWLRREPAIRQIAMSSGDPMPHVFGDLPQIARDAKSAGIHTLLITNWAVRDDASTEAIKGSPWFSPNPRYGKWDDLSRAIKACRDENCRVMLGWEMPPYWYIPAARPAIERQAQRIAECGAEGAHLARAIPDGLVLNPATGSTPDRGQWEGLLASCEAIRSAARKTQPDFCLSTESVWDRLIPLVDVTWASPSSLMASASTDHLPLMRYMFPEWTSTVRISEPFDFVSASNAFRFGYQIVLDGPMDPSLSKNLMEYVRDLARLRRDLFDSANFAPITFDDFLDIKQDSANNIKWTTYMNSATGKKLCILMNYAKQDRSVHIASQKNESKMMVFAPFIAEKAVTLPIDIVIPGERLIVVSE